MSRKNISYNQPLADKLGFSRAVRIGNIIAVTGTAPIAPDGSTAGVNNAYEQGKRCLEIIKDVIEKDVHAETIPVAVDNLKSQYDTAKDILTPFGITVKPLSLDYTNRISEKRSLAKLTELSLPTYTYREIINRIIEEIKSREIYKI